MPRNIDWIGVSIPVGFLTAVLVASRTFPVETIALLLGVIVLRSGRR
jgi:hypothetical protein